MLLESGKYSDLTLICRSCNWKAHKGVLCNQSDFFAKACDEGFKEASTNMIDLSEDNEHAVATMIHFIYHGNYDVNAILLKFAREARIMLLHVRVVGLAQKYFIQALQVYAIDLAVESMKRWNGAPSVFADAVCYLHRSDGSEEDIHTRKTLIDEAHGFIEDWATAMSGCNSSQVNTIANLTAVNESLNADNARLNTNIGVLKSQKAHLNSQNSQATKETETLPAQLNGLPFKTPVKPIRPVNNYDPEPKCYLCPNCEACFVKSMRFDSSFQHTCYEEGWKGKLGKTRMQSSYSEWQNHALQRPRTLWMKAAAPKQNVQTIET
ncbi:hypothetical protein MBLNU13_g04992t2 [Cladosporium sp. NU13]